LSSSPAGCSAALGRCSGTDCWATLQFATSATLQFELWASSSPCTSGACFTHAYGPPSDLHFSVAQPTSPQSYAFTDTQGDTATGTLSLSGCQLRLTSLLAGAHCSQLYNLDPASGCSSTAGAPPPAVTGGPSLGSAGRRLMIVLLCVCVPVAVVAVLILAVRMSCPGACAPGPRGARAGAQKGNAEKTQKAATAPQAVQMQGAQTALATSAAATVRRDGAGRRLFDETPGHAQPQNGGGAGPRMMPVRLPPPPPPPREAPAADGRNSAFWAKADAKEAGTYRSPYRPVTVDQEWARNRALSEGKAKPWEGLNLEKTGLQF
jgi:hypothetical protein